MAICLRFQGGPRAGECLEFDDSVERVTLGRDPRHCQVVFPADNRHVGREHCTLERRHGRYRLRLNRENAVFVDGELVYDDHELSRDCELRLGAHGPSLTLQIRRCNEIPSTKTSVTPVPYLPSTVKDVNDTTVRNRILLIGLTIVVVALAVFGYIALMRQGKHVESVERLAIRRLDDISTSQTAAISELLGEVDGMKRKFAQSESELREHLQKLSPSVYLIVKRFGDGENEEPIGTAWVVGEGVLATNAHVAKRCQEREPDSEILVRSTASSPVDHSVAHVTLHPGFEEFLEQVQAYRPSRIETTTEGAAHRELLPPPECDVALLHLDSSESLGPALSIATEESLDSISQGDPVGYVGFPFEGVAGGGVNISHPIPQVQIGHITAVTDFFLGPTGRDLLQYSMPITGGASGSPIINSCGEVIGIVHAMNARFTPEGRFPLAVGINYGQNIALLKELLDGGASAAQSARALSWTESLRQLASLPKVIEANVVETWGRDATPLVLVAEQFAATSTVANTPEGTYFFARLEMETNEMGRYLFIAMPRTYDPLRIFLYESGNDADPIAVPVSLESYSWVGVGVLDSPGKQAIHLFVTSYSQGAEFDLRVLRVPPPQ